MRAAHGATPDPAITTLCAELASASAQLSRRSRAAAAGPTTRAADGEDDARAALAQLSDRVEQLQQDLAAKDAAYRQSRDQLLRTSAEVAASLPPDAVLVDVREYLPLLTAAKRKAGDQSEPRLVAFVVRHGQPVARVELGPSAPVEAAVDAWRKTFGAGVDGMAAGATLRRLIWQPLLDHAAPQLAGAATVLFSPDGPLCRFPLAALPGDKPGSYLIEDVAVGVIAVPAALPDLLAPSTRPASPPSMLLVGEVDYGQSTAAPPATQPVLMASAGPMHRSAARDGDRFDPLPETRAEIATVREQFEDCFPDGTLVRLRQGQATTAAVRAKAPACRWIHIATHGFFADERQRSAVDASGRPASQLARLGGDERVSGFHPGLLSGIALAGANGPGGPDGDDGILTALEMEEMDLSGVDLAVLSACDTGLGRRAGGEGLLGLQRSLQVAGARTVVASLWDVQDDATRNLMIHFYQSLWHPKPGGPIGKLAALRSAQLEMLREGHQRGLAAVTDAREAAVAADTGRLPPRLWAAFVLSGDWR
jgi:CHAT domain-containing protein